MSLYEPPRSVLGSILLVPGLHFLGPDDPRIVRFATILAHAGILVGCPFLPDFLALRVVPSVVADVERVFEAFCAQVGPGAMPGVMSISFGSFPALRLASSPAYAERVGGLLLFGGYADFRRVMQFALRGEPGEPHDPVNRPAVFVNLLDGMPFVAARDPERRARVVERWMRFVRAAWGRPELKEERIVHQMARELGADLDDEERELFLLGCGASPGGLEHCLKALDALSDIATDLDPGPYLSGLRCPVVVVHGRDDDVIPVDQAERLVEAMPPGVNVKVFLTGLYGHTSRTTHPDQGVAPLREVWNMLRILSAIGRISSPWRPAA